MGLDVWAPTDPAKVQFVACVERIGRGEFVKRCDYTVCSGAIGDPLEGPGGPSAPPGTYSVNLYKTNFRVTRMRPVPASASPVRRSRETTSGETRR